MSIGGYVLSAAPTFPQDDSLFVMGVFSQKHPSAYEHIPLERQ